MIFAEVKNRHNVKEILVTLLDKFDPVEWANQGTLEHTNAYFWVFEKGVKVSVDNLTSLAFQVKCEKSNSALIQKVIDALKKSYEIEVFDKPELEEHE